ncbi:MAG TPA: hypothetical protein VG872_07795 [Acidimicrobiia bacterium]|nr:hypothetical protein [Acidimicrobiia bacterium]
MRSSLKVLATLALIIGACSTGPGGSEGTPTTSPGTSTTSAQPSTSVTTSTVAPTETTSGRPVAPDFTLELGDGGVYTLSEGAKPVYLVFWAEW